MNFVQFAQLILVSFPIYVIMHEPSSLTLSSMKLLHVYADSHQKYVIFQFQCLSHRQSLSMFTDVWYLCYLDLTSDYLIYKVHECSINWGVYWPFWSWFLL